MNLEELLAVIIFFGIRLIVDADRKIVLNFADGVNTALHHLMDIGLALHGFAITNVISKI